MLNMQMKEIHHTVQDIKDSADNFRKSIDMIKEVAKQTGME
jgi:methyl-accepting chemotaxis protein